MKHKRILITGSRHYAHKYLVKKAIRACIEQNEPAVVVHGGASGADALAGECAKELGLEVEVHPADWKRYGKRAGPLRNEQMVKLGADICLAFPSASSKGTWHAIQTAKQAGIETLVFDEPPEAMRYKVIRYDLFDLPDDYILAHCISRDAKMGAGIAKTVRQKWDVSMIEAMSQAGELSVGQAVLQESGGPYPLVHLITKERYWHKPTREDFNKALQDLASKVKEKGYKKLGIPLIGSGLDRLDWPTTEAVIHDTFAETGIAIVVCVKPDHTKMP